MAKRCVSSVLLCAFLVQGCASQIVGEHFAKGSLVREEPSGNIVRESTKRTIELISPCSVRVGQRIELQEETRLYYEKLVIRKTATPLDYPLLDAYLKILLSTAVFPLFTPTYWVQGSYAGPDCAKKASRCTVRDVPAALSGEYYEERAIRPRVQAVHQVDAGQAVSIFVNGYYRGDIALGPEAVATVALHALQELRPLKDIKITFKYFDAYAYSLIKQSEFDAVRKACRAGSTPVPADRRTSQ
jgi:hypothetical protein